MSLASLASPASRSPVSAPRSPVSGRPPSFEGTDALECLFVRHMRARAMLLSVAKVEKESLAEIVWMLKTVPCDERQEVLTACVTRAARKIVPDSGG